MGSEQAGGGGLNWLGFALMTVVTWGVYGVFLNVGQASMGDAVNGRFKAFLFVGLAYFLTAVLAPIAVLLINRADWQMPAKGMGWSLMAGIVGAIGAFCVLLAYGAKGSPPVVMSIVFGGAPIVNAVVAILMNPPAGGWGAIRWPFYLGLLMAALGGFLVTRFRPPVPHGPPPHPAPATATASTATATEAPTR